MKGGRGALPTCERICITDVMSSCLGHTNVYHVSGVPLSLPGTEQVTPNASVINSALRIVMKKQARQQSSSLGREARSRSSGLPATQRSPPPSGPSQRCSWWGHMQRDPLPPAASFSLAFLLFSLSLQLIQEQGGHNEPGAKFQSSFRSSFRAKSAQLLPGIEVHSRLPALQEPAWPKGTHGLAGRPWPAPQAVSTSSPSSGFPRASTTPFPSPVLPSFP